MSARGGKKSPSLFPAFSVVPPPPSHVCLCHRCTTLISLLLLHQDSLAGCPILISHYTHIAYSAIARQRQRPASALKAALRRLTTQFTRLSQPPPRSCLHNRLLLSNPRQIRSRQRTHHLLAPPSPRPRPSSPTAPRPEVVTPLPATRQLRVTFKPQNLSISPRTRRPFDSWMRMQRLRNSVCRIHTVAVGSRASLT